MELVVGSLNWKYIPVTSPQQNGWQSDKYPGMSWNSTAGDKTNLGITKPNLVSWWLVHNANATQS